MAITRNATSSSTRSPSTPTSSVFYTPQSDDLSIHPFPEVDIQLQKLDEQFAGVRLGEDVPLHSIEGDSTHLYAGAEKSKATAHSRNPSWSLSPPPGDSSKVRASPDFENLNGDCTPSGDMNNIGGKRGMSEGAAASGGFVIDPDSSAALSRPGGLSVGHNGSSRPGSRRGSLRANLPRHNVMDEDSPEEHFHHSSVQQAFSDAKRAMSELTDVLSGSLLHNDPDSSMKRFHEEAAKLARFQSPSSRTVGFVGDSGVGKSSLINSLLDFRDLARASNSGFACTCVVTEYHYHDSSNFAIDVEWFTMDETAAHLRELLRAYRQYHLRSPDTDPTELDYLESHAKVAEDTFKAMFKDRLGDSLFLIELLENAVLDTLLLWVKDADPFSTARPGVQESLEECSILLMRLTCGLNADTEAAIWPYIRKIKVFSKAHILSKGLVLVDLPGLRDVNSARSNITERYLLQCDEIFAVCEIKRAVTDFSVTKVFELARQAEKSHIGIVCTRSDDDPVEEAKNYWQEEEAETVQRLIGDLAAGKQKVLDQKAEMDDYDYEDLSDEEVKSFMKLRRNYEDSEKQVEQHEFRMQQYCTSIRNGNVTKSLLAKYGKKVPGNYLKIFCIGNTVYKNHRHLPKEEALPFLQLSGILDLRKHSISLVGDSQLRSAKKYVQDDIPALLKDIELWVQSGAGSVNAEQKEAIRKTLDTLEARLLMELTSNSSPISNIAKSFKQDFRAQIYQKRRVHDWMLCATQASAIWATQWSHCTYSAFCRNFGDHTTKAAKYHNWNEEAIARMATDSVTPWQNLRSTIQISLEIHTKFIEDLMDSAIEYLETELRDSSDSTSTLMHAMSSRQRLLLAEIEQKSEDFENSLYTLRTDALSGIRTSFMGKLMEESYMACNREEGLESHKRRKMIINARLANETIFESIQSSFKNQFNTLAERLQEDILAANMRHLSVIRNTLNIVRNDNIALESEKNPQFRNLVDGKVKAVLHEIRRIQDVVGSSDTA